MTTSTLRTPTRRAATINSITRVIDLIVIAAFNSPGTNQFGAPERLGSTPLRVTLV
jgi:hypothetical protein